MIAVEEANERDYEKRKKRLLKLWKKSKRMRSRFEMQMWRLISFEENRTVLQMLEFEEILLIVNKICIPKKFLIYGKQYKYVVTFVTII